MTAKSIHGNSPEEIRLALEQSLSDDFTPTLAIVFISIKQDRKAVCTILDEMGIDVIGATSAGEFTDGHQSEGASVIMLLDIPKEDYSILCETMGDGSAEVTARQLGEVALRKFNHPRSRHHSSFTTRKSVKARG